MAYESAWVALGKSLLEGKKIGEITLKGKKYKFDYTKEEFIERALLSGWPEDVAKESAESYEKSKVDGYSVQSRFISDFSSDFCLNSGGFGSGKSLALYVKLVLACKCFPGNRVLM